MNEETVELKINEHSETIKEHESRLGTLEKSDVRQETQIGMLCEKLDKIIESNQKWFYLAVATLIGIVGFLVKNNLF